MGTLLVVAAVALYIASIMVLRKGLRQPKSPTQPRKRENPRSPSSMPQFGPSHLGPGAIVSYGGVDYVVRGSVTFREGSFVWWEHLLEGGDQPIWFSVEDDDGGPELAIWIKRTDLELEPGGMHGVNGVVYREADRGTAEYSTEGTTGLPPGGEMDYVDYSDDDETALLSFERWAPTMPWEISTGRSVQPGEVTVYPAPPASA
ncbi:DUF4178 domain-containing protein [Mycobacterium spongiae]|uniref:DUF4178 domain-containing protein n=1 Tax=Mycobacterium spongiae TaxID=886343 RepID=A0A975JWU6_9MYCO|nr:DUF4178 domain-containing protein [Mycobacterium spongiae]QUR67161.1 DUF4178 domain-containing protein [Mycobacterium spongiae]